MGNPVQLDGVLERLRDVRLPDDFIEGGGTPFSGEYEI